VPTIAANSFDGIIGLRAELGLFATASLIPLPVAVVLTVELAELLEQVPNWPSDKSVPLPVGYAGLEMGGCITILSSSPEERLVQITEPGKLTLEEYRSRKTDSSEI
jgi:hypothetical protein